VITGALALVLATTAVWTADEGEPAPRRHVLWLDFAGGPIAPGDDTAAGQAPCIPSEFQYPMFLGSGPAAAAAVEEARRILAPYGVVVRASAPPPELPFTQVRIGGSPDVFGVDEGLNGLSCRGVDCADSSVSDTVFVFSDRFTTSAAVLDVQDEAAPGITLGRIAVHEAAHAWGLEHAGVGDSIMAKFPSAAPDQSFSRGCEPLDLVTDSVCPDERERHCPPGAQDAHAEMLARFGPGGVDDVAPTLEIVAPSDGEELLPGIAITLEVEVDDDRGEVGWSLQVPELSYAWAAPPGERTKDLVLPEGAFTLHVQAIDPDGNVTARSVQVRAADPEPELEGPQSACACRTGTTAWPSAWLALAVLAGALRRRFGPVW
jgi:hypothetical protein